MKLGGLVGNVDIYANLLLTTALATTDQSSIKPFTASEWNKLEERLLKSGVSPGDLLQMTNENIINEFPEYASKIINLLKERGKLPIIIENLKNKGIQIICRSDGEYPQRLLQLLGKLAPPIFFYAGKISLLTNDSIGFVGSRDADDSALDFTRSMASRCAKEGITVVSGGARGVDQTAMNAALKNGGTAIGFLSDSMELVLRNPDWRKAVIDGRLLLLSSQLPGDRFTVWAAMGRNKYIYAQSRCTVVVASTFNKGGTWEGAKENIKFGWVPMYVRDIGNSNSGNNKLLETGKCYPILDARSSSPMPLKDLFTYRDTTGSVFQTISTDRSAQTTASVSNSLFEHFQKILINVLRNGEKSEAEIAKITGLEGSPQIEKWIRKSMDEGTIIRPGKKKVYRLKNDKINTELVTDSIYDFYPVVKENIIRVLSKNDMKLKEIAKKLDIDSDKQMKLWLDKATVQGIIYQSCKNNKYSLSSRQKKLE